MNKKAKMTLVDEAEEVLKAVGWSVGELADIAGGPATSQVFARRGEQIIFGRSKN